MRTPRRGGTLPGIADYYEAMQADLLRYLHRDIGPHGWADAAGMGDYEQAVMSVAPFLFVQRNMFGDDMTRGTGLPELPTTLLQVAAPRHLKDGSVFGTTGIARTLPFTTPDQLPASLWSIRERGLPMPLAHEAAMYLAMLPLDAQPAAPDAVGADPPISLLGTHPRFGVTTLATSRADPVSYLFTLNLGSYPSNARFGGGGFTLRGLRHDWATGFAYADNPFAQATANILTIAGFSPAAAPTLLTRDIESNQNGSARGTLTLRLNRWARDPDNVLADAAEPVWTRSIALDTPGTRRRLEDDHRHQRRRRAGLRRGRSGSIVHQLRRRSLDSGGLRGGGRVDFGGIVGVNPVVGEVEVAMFAIEQPLLELPPHGHQPHGITGCHLAVHEQQVPRRLTVRPVTKRLHSGHPRPIEDHPLPRRFQLPRRRVGLMPTQLLRQIPQLPLIRIGGRRDGFQTKAGLDRPHRTLGVSHRCGGGFDLGASGIGKDPASRLQIRAGQGDGESLGLRV